MKRRHFISATCGACVSGAVLSNFLSACASAHYVTGELEPKGISVHASEFISPNKKTREFVVVHHDQLEFPIYLYKLNDSEYSALWMKCTHQGSELNAGGDHLYCSSHGSEFDKKGKAIHGPAERNLRSFPASVLDTRIIIELTKE